jgi:hypothetical protein
MHDAFYLVDVIPPIEGEKLSCFTYVGDVLLVGTVSGRVISFRVTTTRGGDGRAEHRSTRERTFENSSRSPISAIEAAPDLGIAVAVCDGAAIVLKLPALERTTSCLEAKNALWIAFDAFAERLCVFTTKKKIKVRGCGGRRFRVVACSALVRERTCCSTSPPPPPPPSPRVSFMSGCRESSRRSPSTPTSISPKLRAVLHFSKGRSSLGSSGSTKRWTRKRVI